MSQFSGRHSSFLVLLTIAALACSGCSDKSVDDGRVGIPTPVPQTEIDVDPAWSPDGSKIIYFRYFAAGYNHRDTSWAWGVFLHDVATGTDSLLWESRKYRQFDWSPEGERIVWTSDAQIYLGDLALRNVIHVESVDRAHAPCWSPCGNCIVFFVRLGEYAGMYMYNFSASISRFILRGATDGGWISGCDSLAVIYRANNSPSDIALYSITGSQLSFLPHLDKYKRGISASPDGRTLLIARDGYGAYTNIWKYDRNGGTYAQLTLEGGDHPDWSPDGQWIVYTMVNKDNGYLWIMRPDGSEKRQITF